MLKKYGIPTPTDDLLIDLPIEIELSYRKEGKIKKKDREIIKNKRKEVQKKLEENKKKYEDIKKKVENTKDPLEPLHALILKSVNIADLNTLNEAISIVTNISEKFFQSTKTEKTTKKWNPFNNIVHNFGMYLDMCDR